MGPGTIASVAFIVAANALPSVQTTCPGNRSPQPIWWRCPFPPGSAVFIYYEFMGTKTSENDTSHLSVPPLAEFNADCLRGFLTELAITGPFVATGNDCFPPQACTAIDRYVITRKLRILTTQQILSGLTNFPECPPLNTTIGIISYPNGRRYYANAKIICPEGYVLNSQNPVFCESDGRWRYFDGTKFAATKAPNISCIACSNPPVIQNGDIVSCSGRNTAEIQCNDGYTFSGRSTVLHFNKTKWTDPEGFCLKHCPASQDISNGFLRIHDVRVNSTAQVICDNNFNINANRIAICKFGGNWSIPNASCDTMSCGYLTSPTNGKVSSGSNKIHTVRAYACQDGFKLKGSNATLCVTGQHKPKWVPDTPECVLNYCRNPTSPINGILSNGSNDVYSVKHCSCDEGYQLMGSKSIKCVAGQHGPEWVPETPECVHGPPMATPAPATPGNSEYGDLLGFSGSIASIATTACLVVALIVLSLVSAVALRRRRPCTPSSDSTEMHPVATNKLSRTSTLHNKAAFSGQPLMDQLNNGVNTPLGPPCATKATKNAIPLPAGELQQADIYETVEPDNNEVTDAPNACYQSLVVEKEDGLILGNVYASLTETPGARESLYRKTGAREVGKPPLGPADLPPPPDPADLPPPIASIIGEDNGGLHDTILLTTKKRKNCPTKLVAEVQLDRHPPTQVGTNPDAIYANISVSAGNV